MLDEDAAIARWITQLSDPRRALQVPVYGHLRSRSWGFEERRLPEHLLQFVVCGGHVGHVNGEAVRTATESVIWVPPGIRQHIRAAPGTQPLGIYYLRFSLAGPPPPLHGPYVRDGMGDAYPLFVRLLHECGAELAGREEYVRSLLVMIFSEWRRAAHADGDRLNERQRTQIIELVDRDPLLRLHPARLSQAVGMSANRFLRCFQRTFGMPPRTWLMHHRIRLAAQRLSEERLAIGELAREFGYRDLFLFSRQFKAVMGMSPRRWLKIR